MSKINRRGFLGLVGAGAAWAVLPAGCGRDEPKTDASRAVRKPLKNRPEIDHIILISVDTLRADHLACYGHRFVQTPNSDALAKESIVFTQHISTASSTLASHTSLMTGTYPHTHGAARNGYIVGKENIMLAENLKKAGFVTAGFIGAMPLDAQFNFNQGFDEYDTNYEFIVREMFKDQAQRRAQSVTNSVLNWLDKRSSSGKINDRLFLFVHYWDPHLPYDAPKPFRGMYREQGSSFDHSIEATQKARLFLMRTRADSRGAQRLAKAYDAEYSAEITYCDYHIGRLMEGLKKQGLFDNALIILTSDHGETINEHLDALHHGKNVYDTEILTPLIVRFPGGQFGGRQVSRLVSNIDVVPAINHLLDLPDNKNIEGQSFAKIIDGPLGLRSPVFAEATQPWRDPDFDSDPLWANRGKFQCIRTDRYKYMFRLADNKFAFYDLQKDPMEQNNLLEGNNRAGKKLAKSLRKQLERWRDDVNTETSSKPTDSEEAIRALKSLGYVGDGE